MGLSEILIGKNMKAHPDCLGIYIGLDELYMAQTARKDGGVVLESLVRVPINGVDRSALKPLDLNEAFFLMDKWTEALAKVMSKKQWKTKRVVVSLAPAFCLLRHFVIPQMIERRTWKTAVPMQALKYIHFPHDKESVHAYHVYEFETAATKQKRLGVVFAMTSKTIIDRLHKGLKSCGLELVSVEPSSLSLGRAFNDSDKEAVGTGGRIYSFFGKDVANFVFLNENSPVLLREVEISGSLPAERRRFEITNCTEFIAKQLEKDPFEEAVIAGVDVEQWIPALEADSKKPVRRWNLSEVYGIETRSVGEIAAIGASTKFFDRKTPDIDFVKGNRLSDYEVGASVTMWCVAGLAVLILLALMGKGYWKVAQMKQTLKQKEASYTTKLPDFEGLSASQIQSNLNKIKNQNSTLQTLLRNDHPITPILVELTDTIPQDVWITRVNYSDEYPRKSAEGRAVTLDGQIKSATKDGRDDFALGNKFKDSLAGQSVMRRICGSGANIQYSDVAGVSTGGKGDEKDTRFTFTCGKGGR